MRTSLPVQEIPNQGSGAIVYSASDAANGNMFPNDGRTVLIANNPTGGALAITITSVPDEFNRTGDITVNLAAGETRLFGPLAQRAWNQSTADVGNVYVAPAAGLNLAAVRLHSN